MCKIVTEKGIEEKGDPRDLGYGGVSQILFEQEDERNFDKMSGNPVDPEMSDLYLRGANGMIRFNRIFLERSLGSKKSNAGTSFPNRVKLLESLEEEDKNIFQRRLNLLETLSEEEKQVILHRNN